LLEFIKPVFGLDFTEEQETFYLQNNKTVLELFACVCAVTPDKAELKQWHLTQKQWRQCVMASLFDAGTDMTFETTDDDTGAANTGSHRKAITRDEAFYIFGINDITDSELAFMTELYKNDIDLHKNTCLVRTRQSDRKRYNLSEKQWRKCMAMAIYESISDIFCYGL